MSKKNYNFTQSDYEFMDNLNAAILEKSPKKVSIVLNIVLLSIVVFVIWAAFTQIDEITRGSGDVVPSGDNQIVQNLEGGIADKILVSEGDSVKKGQVLVKITNSKSLSSQESNEIKLKSLTAKVIRLVAESDGVDFIRPETSDPILVQFFTDELSLHESRQREMASKDKAIIEQIKQKKHDLKEIEKRIKHLNKSHEFIVTEVNMIRPMVKQGIKSRVDFLKLQREANEIEQKLDSAKDSKPSMVSQIDELEHKRTQETLTFRNEAKKELNAANAEVKQVASENTSLSDQVHRTDVRSPVDGIVKKLLIHTVGGVISPGSDIVEIVPSDDALLLEIKIKPSDIAFIHPGAEAMAKFSAYDFGLHGGLKGEIVRISPDTITDEKDNKFYLIYIKTKKTHLGTDAKPLNIIPGMTADVDIVTGKKSILDYILKPILKSKTYVFSEK